jgi:hypothetical protein
VKIGFSKDWALEDNLPTFRPLIFGDIRRVFDLATPTFVLIKRILGNNNLLAATTVSQCNNLLSNRLGVLEV